MFSQEDHFQIEFDQFSPDANLMIQMMEDNPAEPFSGHAHNDEDISFENMIGTPMLLWFWDIKDELSQGQIEGMNLMNQIFQDKVRFIGFVYDKRPLLNTFIRTYNIDFPVIPDSFRLGELHYGSEMGQGRIFLVNRSGTIQKAIPREFFIDNQNSFSQLRSLIQELVDGKN